MKKLEVRIYEFFKGNNGIELLDDIQKSLFNEIPKDTNNTNDFLIIDGKRQLIRDIINICQLESIKANKR